MDLTMQLANNFFQLANEASPWLLLGLIIAGLMKTWVPTQILSRHLGKGNSAIVKAAFIGAPLPLCSCGVIPVATQLKRSGASSPATSSFLVATPETGVDSVTVSYALLGPVMAIYRPITAVLSAIFTGFLVKTTDEKNIKNQTPPIKSSCCSTSPTVKAEKSTNCGSPENTSPLKTSCCSTDIPQKKKLDKTSCCSTTKTEKVKTACCSTNGSQPEKKAQSSSCKADPEIKLNSFKEKTVGGLKYAFTQLVDDLILWLLAGLIFATLVRTFLPTDFLVSYGSGLIAMLIMIGISIPMYICATASTPIAAGFILAGVSPGTALVFMMAGPATNISTLGVIRNEMGDQVLLRYLLGIALSAILFGYMLDLGLGYFNIAINEQMSHSHELLPAAFSIFCTGLLAFLSIKPLRQVVLN